MKNIITNLLCFFTLCLLVLSCDENAFLEETELPDNQVATNFDSNQELDNILRGGYFNLGAPTNVSSLMTGLTYNDLVADVMELKPFADIALATNSEFITPVYERQVEVNDNIWITQSAEGAYMVINSANTVLDFYRKNPIPEDNPQWATRIQGEASFLRALGHFQLVSMFAPPFSSDSSAPAIVLRRVKAIDAADLPGLSTVEETYSFIIEDLKRAIELLPESYDPQRDPDWYQDGAKKAAARFLLARVYFQMGSSFWTSGLNNDAGALGQINAIIDSNMYSVDSYSNLQDIYNRKGLGNIAPETVFQVAYYFRNGWRVPKYHFYYGNLNNRRRGLPFSKSILNRIGWNDESTALQDRRYNDLFIRFDKDGLGVNGSDPLYALNYEDDYNVWCIKNGANNGQRQISYVVFRLPELYLMRSVIRLREGDNVGATQDLNVTRLRAGLSALSAVTDSDIEEEWLKELSFEHRRLSYLQATQKDVPPGDRPNFGPVSYDDPSLVRELPLKQITRNPNID